MVPDNLFTTSHRQTLYLPEHLRRSDGHLWHISFTDKHVFFQITATTRAASRDASDFDRRSNFGDFLPLIVDAWLIVVSIIMAGACLYTSVSIVGDTPPHLPVGTDKL